MFGQRIAPAAHLASAADQNVSSMDNILATNRFHGAFSKTAYQSRRNIDGGSEIVDDLTTHTDKKQNDIKTESKIEENTPLAQLEKAEAASEDRPEKWRTGKPVLCIPGPSLLDEAAATMVAHLVGRQGIGARAEQADALSMSRIFDWETQDIGIVCLCYVEYATPAQIRYAIRRVRRRVPDVPILVALFGNTESFEGDEEGNGAEFVQQSLCDVVDKIKAVGKKLVEAQRSPATPVIALAS
jgi:hypothetical protein